MYIKQDRRTKCLCVDRYRLVTQTCTLNNTGVPDVCVYRYRLVTQTCTLNNTGVPDVCVDRYRLMFLKITPEEMKKRKEAARKPIIKVAEVGGKCVSLCVC